MAATDLEKLVVQLGADFRSYENAMARASGITRRQLAQIKADATAAGGAAAVGFDGATTGVQRFGKGAQAASKQVNSLKGQTGNLAAQFQDIAVQLQSGQSPFTIALQQGTQISSVLGGTGARGAVAALGGAFLSLLNPVSLATIGIIAAGGAAVQYFSNLSDDGEKSAEELKAQADLIRRVADEWGDALPAVKAYADEVARAAQLADIASAGETIRANIYGPAREQVAELADQLVVLRGELEGLGSREDVANVSALQKAFTDLQEKVNANTATAEDGQRVQEVLGQLMDVGAASAEGFAGALSILTNGLTSYASQADASTAATEALIKSTNALNNLSSARAAGAIYRKTTASTADYIKEQERLNGLTAEQIDLEQRRDTLIEGAREAGGSLGVSEATRLAEAQAAAEKAREAAASASRSSGGTSGGGSRSKAVSEAEREREAVAKLIDTLAFENSLIGKTDLEREKANQLRRAGTVATAENRAEIEALVEAGYAATEALRRTEEQMAALKDLSREVLGGMVDDLIDGADAADIFANALTRIGGSLANKALDGLIEAAFSGGLGGIFGGSAPVSNLAAGVYHDGGVVGSGGAPSRNVPASVFANAKRMHTGGLALRPGEVPIIAQSGERIIPRGGSAGSTPVDVRLHVDRDGNWQAAVEKIAGRQIGAAAPRIASMGVEATRASMQASKRGWR